MQLHATPLSGVIVVASDVRLDHRGSFGRLYCERELAEVLCSRRIVQINQSRTKTRGAVRGMHFQWPPHAEMKLVRCLKGRVWDVALDLRSGSPTFLQWHAQELSQDNAQMMVIPEGFAHGFQTLEPESELLYLHTDFYAPASEDGICCTDPYIAIHWPLAITEISQRDSSHAPLSDDFQGITL